jgi:hypothetical protein
MNQQRQGNVVTYDTVWVASQNMTNCKNIILRHYKTSAVEIALLSNLTLSFIIEDSIRSCG